MGNLIDLKQTIRYPYSGDVKPPWGRLDANWYICLSLVTLQGSPASTMVKPPTSGRPGSARERTHFALGFKQILFARDSNILSSIPVGLYAALFFHLLSLPILSCGFTKRLRHLFQGIWDNANIADNGHEISITTPARN